MSILTRIRTLISANINSMIDSAEDPEKMVEEYLRQMRDQLEEARAATAMAMADETRLQAKYQQNQTASDDWQRKAELAVQHDDDELAREALGRKTTAQGLSDSYRTQWQAQHDQVGDLREALAELEAKINEAEAKRELIIVKQHRAQTQEAISSAMHGVDDPTGENSLDRMEDKADERLARAQAMAQVSANNIDNRFQDLERNAQVQSDLDEIKRRMGKS